jgi:hypothetical protein
MQPLMQPDPVPRGARSAEREAQSAKSLRAPRAAHRAPRFALRAPRFALRAPRPATAVVVWAVILLAIGIRGLHNPRRNSVYPIYARAARHFLAGTNLYRAADGPYRYSPLAAALLVPFTLCPGAIGGVLWRLLNASVYLAALAWFCRRVLPVPLTAQQQALLYLLIIPLSVGSLNNAQSNALVLGLLLAGVAAVASRHWSLASGCVALACLYKIYPVAVGLLLAAVYPRRFAGRFLLALAIGLALPFLFKPPAYVLEQYGSWFHHLQADDRQQLPIGVWYRDLRLLCRACQVPLGPTAYLLLQLLAAAGIAALCLWGRWVGWAQRRLLTTLFSLACCWMTLFGPATESSTYILLAPALAWTILAAWLGPAAPWGIRTGLLASFGLFTVTQAAVWFPGGARQVRMLGLHPLAALLLLVCLIGMEIQESFRSKAAGSESDGLCPASASGAA